MSTEKLYAERDACAQGDHYMKHVSAMTGEKLHSKSAIASELAYRDMEIERLTARIKDYQDLCNQKQEIINGCLQFNEDLLINEDLLKQISEIRKKLTHGSKEYTKHD
jgi:hypothetical protein